MQLVVKNKIQNQETSKLSNVLIYYNSLNYLQNIQIWLYWEIFTYAQVFYKKKEQTEMFVSITFFCFIFILRLSNIHTFIFTGVVFNKVAMYDSLTR